VKGVRSEESLFRQCYEPKDWVFVFACPTTRRSFLRARAYGEFCHQFKNWEHYKSLFLNEFEKCIVPFERTFGLTIVRLPKSRQFGRILCTTNAVVLFAHCDGSSHRIEFADGMIPYGPLIEGVEKTYSGILELSVCRPGDFADQLKSHAPRSAVKSVNAHLDAVGWLWFYGAFFSRLAREQCSYAEAIMAASAVFARPPSPPTQGASSKTAMPSQ
jgi:hypothetical protein